MNDIFLNSAKKKLLKSSNVFEPAPVDKSGAADEPAPIDEPEAADEQTPVDVPEEANPGGHQPPVLKVPWEGNDETSYPPKDLAIGDTVATAYQNLEFATVTTVSRMDVDGEEARGLDYFKWIDKEMGLVKKIKRPLKTDDKTYFILEKVNLIETGNNILKVENYENIKKHYNYYTKKFFT